MVVDILANSWTWIVLNQAVCAWIGTGSGFPSFRGLARRFARPRSGARPAAPMSPEETAKFIKALRAATGGTKPTPKPSSSADDRYRHGAGWS
jgi:hypothetical protein